eukprot:CAMPEP_0117452492 /NCGR_PEP_ID=MMETSP0759-20121206/9650_1 /TAXON_ID=63605 /ORGANISM="Percolomonas cosmopolitus, Strain WS" /LENGTH=305 /DNA_ID=CAMNT_0005245323 /DNA_START=673 /DNA_END=1590 /DNA_ORIENTATION=-
MTRSDVDDHDSDRRQEEITSYQNSQPSAPIDAPPPEYPPIERRKPLGPPIIHLHNISKQYKLPGREKPVEALKKIDLSRFCEFDAVREGEFLMVRGASGGGKTTLLNIIGTIDKPTTGELRLLGHRISSKSSDNFLSKLRLKHIGFVFQTFNLIATMSAFENVELPMTLHGKLNKKKRRQRAKDLLKSVGLEDRMGHLPSELSGGEQQRVTIARALANKPEILILDEATASLDTNSSIEVMNLILEINLKHKTTIVFVTHNPDLECYADRIVYVKDGVIVKQAVNSIQTPLIFEYYQQYLKSNEQ